MATKNLDATLAPDGDVPQVVVGIDSLVGAIEPVGEVGVLKLQLARAFAGTIASESTLVKAVSISLGGTLAPFGNLPFQPLSFGSTLTPTGSLSRIVKKNLSGLVGCGGSLQASKGLLGSGSIVLGGTVLVLVMPEGQPAARQLEPTTLPLVSDPPPRELSLV